MKSLEKLYKEVIADDGEKKKFIDAVKIGKIDDFLTEHGCSATVSEIKRFIEKIRNGELADDELGNVSGGGCLSDVLDKVEDSIDSVKEAARKVLDSGDGDGSGAFKGLSGAMDTMKEAIKKQGWTSIGIDTNKK